MEFYEILREIMDEKGMTVSDVARVCGLRDSTVRSIFMRQQKNVALEVAFKLSRGLKVSLERLNGLPEPGTPEPPSEEIPQSLIDTYRQLDTAGKSMLLNYADFLAEKHQDKKKHPPQDG